MKWLFFLALCSPVNQICSENYSNNKLYDDFYGCIQGGVVKSLEIIKNTDRQEFNKNKISIQLYCQAVNEDHTYKTTKQGLKLS